MPSISASIIREQYRRLGKGLPVSICPECGQRTVIGEADICACRVCGWKLSVSVTVARPKPDDADTVGTKSIAERLRDDGIVVKPVVTETILPRDKK